MKRLQIAVAALIFTLVGCGGDDAGVTTTVPVPRTVDTFGAELFEERVVGANPGCITCHSREEGVTLVGPSLFAVETRVPELSTEEYILQSIVTPDAHIVEGFVPGQMHPGWDEYLTDEQINSLVVFLSE